MRPQASQGPAGRALASILPDAQGDAHGSSPPPSTAAEAAPSALPAPWQGQSQVQRTPRGPLPVNPVLGGPGTAPVGAEGTGQERGHTGHSDTVLPATGTRGSQDEVREGRGGPESNSEGAPSAHAPGRGLCGGHPLC